MSSSDGGPGSREVAYRLFATEYDDATLDHSESDEERAPNYVVTPTGGRVNRLFVIGVLTEVESVSEDVLRARVVDPTGAFVIYAGQYQPEAKAFLDRAEPPTFVSVTGKARTYSPDDSDRVFTSVRPESINEVDADSRDRWTVQAAELTLDRIATMAAAIDRPERGEDLTAVLLEAGVDPGLATGIPLAIDHYDTTTGYLEALRTVAIQTVEVVAGDRNEVEPVNLAPAEGGAVRVDFAADLDAAEPGAVDVELEASEAHEPEEVAEPEPEREPEPASEPEPAAEGADEAPSVEASTPDMATAEVETDGPGDFDDFGESAASDDDLYEMDEDERREVEEEFGTEFTAGTEVDEPGEADLETETEPPSAGEEPAGDAAASEPEPEPEEPSEPTEPDEAETEPAEPVDLESAVVEAMRDLDDGDGAQRDEVVATVGDAHNVAEDEVEDAIDDALMSGQCYEPEDGRLKAV